MHFNFPHYVPGKLKFIYRINVYSEKNQTIHQVINGLLHSKNYRLLCLDDEYVILRQQQHSTSKYYYEPALQEQEINADPEYNDGGNANTGSSNAPRYNPINP